ncbi:PHP domain-containing protein [Mumia sp. zg.B17]|uniref:PHP domain-containing protein n=1 Tax=Mumia sp. zg.B17 TaxID=2855446 RepID=UPI001C6E1C42|nr:PHP domain-containing protein [Mumia sp. zg.B17]MBW9206892.1 PHP domain-containing protein [Mumia sp. zg.B17]
MNLTDTGPSAALREIAYLLERSRSEPRRPMAYRKAADVYDALDEDRRAQLAERDSWSELSGVGAKTAAVIAQASAGRVPDTLARLREEDEPVPGDDTALRAALRGDLHTHSTWSDGGASIEEMMRTAVRLGHDYCALTDHSPRLTVARGLSPERLREQLDVVERLNEELSPFRILTGIEVDILDDGSLDQEPELLERLDVVVASVHSRLKDDADTMTRRMVAAVANPHTDVLGHVTGRLVEGSRGTRPESAFNPEIVFEACKQFDTALEINSRPERRDPPSRLLDVAVERGCLFSIDTDAHASGQLSWQGLACVRAEAAGITAERVVDTWPLDELLAWTQR